MKVIAIFLGISFLVLLGVQLFAMKTQNGIETYPYKVIKKYQSFEVREYESSLFTSVKISDNKYETGSSKGFSVLAGYIFGGNDRNEKIAMTSPVTMSLGDTMTMMFMVPKELEKEALPKPNDSSIVFHEEPVKTVAAIRFSGWASDEKIEKYKKKLIAALEKEGIEHTGKFQFLGYNAPYEMTNRRNEVIVELKK